MRGAGTKARRVGISAGMPSEKRSPLQGSVVHRSPRHGVAPPPLQASFRRLSTKTWPVGPDGDCQLCRKCATEETVPIEIPTETGLTISLVPRWPATQVRRAGGVPRVRAVRSHSPCSKHGLSASTMAAITLHRRPHRKVRDDVRRLQHAKVPVVPGAAAIPIEISTAAVSGAAAHKCRRLQMSLETFGGAPGVRWAKPPLKHLSSQTRATTRCCCRRPADLLSRVLAVRNRVQAKGEYPGSILMCLAFQNLSRAAVRRSPMQQIWTALPTHDGPDHLGLWFFKT